MLFQVTIAGEGPDGGPNGVGYTWRVEAENLREATQLALKPIKTSSHKYDVVWPPIGQLTINSLIP